MNDITILKIAIIESAKLAIFPAESNSMYEYIYREAAGVYWDKHLNCFKSTEMREWSCGKWFMHMISLIESTFQIHLVISKDTEFQSDQLKNKILEALMDTKKVEKDA